MNLNFKLPVKLQTVIIPSLTIIGLLMIRLLMAQETLNYLKGRFAVESWGELTLKGKEIPITVYQVLGKI